MNNRTYINFPVTSKSGFIALTDVVICGSDGKFFHAASPGQKFNMPKGNYFLSGKVNNLPAPLNSDIAFYPFERDDRQWNEYKIFVCNNPNKASVIFASGIAFIFLDHSIAELPSPCVQYAIEHELAHAHYKQKKGEKAEEVENRCDCYAEHKMLQDGYNPSQLKFANNQLLSRKWRKHKCTQRMKNNFGK